MTSLFRLLVSFSVLASLASATLALGQDADLNLRRLPWDIFAETMEVDGKTSTYIYTGVQFSQGNISIKADEGRASRRDQENSAWQFSGNVVIDVNNGHIECEDANLQFDNNELKIAVVTGSPATFRVTRPGNENSTTARAGRLLYDVVAGVIEFSDQATITEGGNQISSNFLVYNILEQKINADSQGSEDGRVRITYTPTDGEAVVTPQDEDETP
jgi:lipopolysaccharide export system protein LptA